MADSKHPPANREQWRKILSTAPETSKHEPSKTDYKAAFPNTSVPTSIIAQKETYSGGADRVCR